MRVAGSYFDRHWTTKAWPETAPDEELVRGISIFDDRANNCVSVRTSQGVMFGPNGYPTHIGPDARGPERWTTISEALKHFAKVDRILRSL